VFDELTHSVGELRLPGVSPHGAVRLRRACDRDHSSFSCTRFSTVRYGRFMRADGEMSYELRVAEVVSAASVWGIGRALGEPIQHDDGSRQRMFDIEFPHTTPKAALEVTSIVDGPFAATADAAQKVVDRELTALALEAKRNLHYVFHVSSGTSVRAVSDEMKEIIRSGKVPTDRNPAPGLNKVDSTPSEEPLVTIATWSGGGVQPLRGFGMELIEAVESNRQKLREAEGYERHLAVDLVGMRSALPHMTPPPRLPNEIDFIWVTRRHYSEQRGAPVVWVSDGLGSWRTNGEPHEAL
jgi:hypothetical protein